MRLTYQHVFGRIALDELNNAIGVDILARVAPPASNIQRQGELPAILTIIAYGGVYQKITFKLRITFMREGKSAKIR